MKKTITLLLLIVTLKISAQTLTWNMGMNISSNIYSNMHPRMALDASGNPMVIWGRMSDESVFFTRWNGSAFTMPVKLNPSWLTVATASWMGPDIASHGDTVYVVMKRTPEASNLNYTYIMRSFDGGQNFSAPVRIDFIADSISRFPTVTTDATGNPVVAFMKFNSSFGASRWAVTNSTDYGNTFSTDVKATIGSDVCDCCPGAILSDGNMSAMLFRNNATNIRDNWVGISSNNSASFDNGFNVDNNNWMLTSCPSSGPDGVIIDDTLYSVFMNGANVNYRAYLSKSSLHAFSANQVSNLTGNISGLSQQNYPRIATDGNAAAIVWKQVVNGNAQLPVLFTDNIRNGFPAMYDTVDLGDITNADVAVSNGIVFVVWEDDNSGTVKYCSASFTPLNTSINEIENNHFSVFPNPVFSDEINIDLSNISNEKKELTVSNLLGETLIHHSTNENGILKMNIGWLSAGTYFIKLMSADQFFVTRIVIL